MRFPSTEWFQAVQKAAEAERTKFRRIGFCDATVRLDVRGPRARSFVLTFEDYGMTSVREVAADSAADADFSLSGDEAVWREMIRNVRAEGEADLEHTLNQLQLPGLLELGASDQLRADLFYRYNQTFQEFFNQAARVPTEFDPELALARSP
jgi:hypothetical protein